MKLYLIRGLPGTGKSTLAQSLKSTLETVGPAIVIESDQFFLTSNGYKEVYKFDRRLLGAAHDECYGRTMRYLRSGHTVIVANTFSTKREIDRYRNGITRSGMDVKTIILRCDGPWKSPHNVPARAIEKMRDRWEPVPGEVLYKWEDDV